MQGLDDLVTQLGSGSSAQVQSAMNALTDAETAMRTAQAETGARMGAMKDLAANQNSSVLQMQDARSALADADPAQAVVELQSAQTALEQAYSVTSKVLSMNLLDFLK
jgi:flagellin-like hook-associated protein FlgL